MENTAYYNECDQQKAAWLRELIACGLIAPGDVDERSIETVRPGDLRGYAQCHFFAGIGIWSYALRLAGWPDERPVWTGSCPCPSFSAAGKGRGFNDSRHLWPTWYPLIRECRPSVVVGEQADDAIGYGWLDLVSTDLEASAYAVAAAVLGACSVGAPHIRQRLYWVAESLHAERRTVDGHRKDGRDGADGRREEAHGIPGACGEVRGMADTDGRQSRNGNLQRSWQHGLFTQDRGVGELDSRERPGPVNGFWRNADWIFCTDGFWRPVEPGTFPLVNGVAARMGRLRGYGDAICAQTAEAFIRAYVECEGVCGV